MGKRDVAIDGLYNFRDIGGLPLAAGGTTNHGVLFRSDGLSHLSPDGLAALAATPIGVVVDLRTPAERAAAPDRLPNTRSVGTVEIPLLEGAMADAAKHVLGDSSSLSPELIAQALSHLPTLDEMYVGMLKNGAGAFAEIARLVASPNDETHSAVLVHCTAGKDRTGVATALLLDAVGVEREALISDYASSQDHLAGSWTTEMLRQLDLLDLPQYPALSTLVTGTPPAAIEQAMKWVADEFGGADGYLLSGGLSESELVSLRNRLTG